MEKITKKIAIFGCGLSSLSFLHSFSPKDNVSIRIFEKNSQLSSRASTQKISENFIDMGANYLCTEDQEILELITQKLDSSELTEIDKWVFPFDKTNLIDFDLEKARKHNILKKFNYKCGIGHLSDLLLKSTKTSDFQIIYNKKITKIHEVHEKKYEVFSYEENLGEYDMIILAIPTPNALKILMKSKFLSENQSFLNEIASLKLSHHYKTIFSLAIGFHGFEDLSFYALINFDREHAISWLSVENEKKGHIKQEDLVVLIVQAADWFIKEMIPKKNEEIIEEIKKELFKVLPSFKEKKVEFEVGKNWKYALPQRKIEGEVVEILKEKRIFMIGDGVIGKGRIDGSMRSGIDLYGDLKSFFV